ncbi:MAG: FCD domain-containing protein [Alphaproteobacteria bacterium]|nr:FCD domain-containing protein [Alphaproteobacteria bacterium]MBU1515413.1 FCD domain-containing protein [Alphaproteobacteria bacterium]MBU2092952.1 FCD domain-containing protein [Alphaproteobacteria bacterium]MBU2153584.1 FCD domain-containing protein [Alphaproteobacteria bacterium]MBU2309897.1 FCD domain-containing protein [Alphaproteobacteria bacterium]
MRKKTSASGGDEGPANERSIRIPKAAELIAETIRQRVVQGELKSGDALPSEPELMIEFHVSRASLREAFRILEAESLIEVKRGARGGARIRLPRDDTAAKSIGILLQIRGATLRELFDARLIMEPPLIHQLAMNRTEADLDELRAHVEYEREHMTDFRAFGIAAAEFHRILVRQAGNITLALFVGMLDELYLRQLNRFIARARPDQATLNKASYNTHMQLVETIASKDGDAAETIWRYHMQRSRKVILTELGEDALISVY